MAEQLFVLGHPVGHSKSPVMHNAAYRALGLDWVYAAQDCATLAEAQEFLSGDSWMALNITMPYKPQAYEAARWRSEAARLALGANVLVRRGDELLADNTDGKGCVSYLQRCGVAFDDAHVVVCGTGPTSLAIMHACARAGARQVALLGRDEAKTRRVMADYADLCADVHATSGAEVQAMDYASAADTLQAADLIVDATPLGMKLGDPAPFDTGLLCAGQTVFDVVYGHGVTALVAAARAAGANAYDGAGMLVAQAVETVHDIVDWLDVPVDLAQVDLFNIMYSAAFSESD